MTRQYLNQELGITYYRTMNKIVQYQRNTLKNIVPFTQSKIPSTQVFAQEVIQ